MTHSNPRLSLSRALPYLNSLNSSLTSFVVQEANPIPNSSFARSRAPCQALLISPVSQDCSSLQNPALTPAWFFPDKPHPQPSPPLALSFRKTKGKSHILAVSDEEGFVSYYDSKKYLHCHSSCWDKTAEARVFEWAVHENAIFDICWIKNYSHLLTASGDQAIKMWNAERRKCIGLLTRHAGSVKLVSPHS